MAACERECATREQRSSACSSRSQWRSRRLGSRVSTSPSRPSPVSFTASVDRSVIPAGERAVVTFRLDDDELGKVYDHGVVGLLERVTDHLPDPGQLPRERLRLMTDEAMYRLAAMLPTMTKAARTA